MIRDDIFTESLIFRKLAELDYRIDKLKKMGLKVDREDLIPVNKDENIDGDVSFFFLPR